MDDDYCIKNPYNTGITCTDHTNCEKCGWNPKVEANRKKQTLERLKLLKTSRFVPYICEKCVALPFCYLTHKLNSSCAYRSVITVDYFKDMVFKYNNSNYEIAQNRLSKI